MSNTMQGFNKQFREENYFKKPLDREWVIKTLTTHVERQKKEWGGLVSKKNDPRQFNRIVVSYESLTLEFINTVPKKDHSVKNGMLSSLGVAIAGPVQVSGVYFLAKTYA